jgi:hypothetical protein
MMRPGLVGLVALVTGCALQARSDAGALAAADTARSSGSARPAVADPPELFRTDRHSYVLEPVRSRSGAPGLIGAAPAPSEAIALRTVVQVTFTNQTAGPVLLRPCTVLSPEPHAGTLFYVLQKEHAAEWLRAHDPDCRLSPAPRRVLVKPGGEYVDRLVLWHDLRPRFSPRLETSRPAGVYRFVFDAWAVPQGSGENAGAAAGTLLPLEQRVSNPFEIEEPAPR